MMRKFSWAAILLATTYIYSACEKSPASEAGTVVVPGINLADMDTSVNPGENFYRFVNGGWLEDTEIPADKGRWSSFNELRDYNNEILLKVLNQAQENGKYAEDSDEMKAYRYYQVAMDSLKAEKVGIEPLKPILKEIEEVSSKEELLDQIASLHMKGINPFFGSYVTADRKLSEQTAMHITQGGLGLPNRDYYLKEDNKSEEIKQKYVTFISDMLGYIGYDSAKADQAAENIMALETELAKASMSNVERRNPVKTYNKYTVEKLTEETPNFDWGEYFSQLAVSDVDSVIVGQPVFFKKVSEVIGQTDLALVKDYLKWNVINSAAEFLNHEIVKRNFDFYVKVIQ